MRDTNITLYVAQNDKRPDCSAVDRRTTRPAGYKPSQVKRKRIEEVFGWPKTVGVWAKPGIAAFIRSAGSLPSPLLPTIWCGCEICPPHQFLSCKSRERWSRRRQHG